jgi:outer membrane protein assembly factor BamB
LVQVPSTLKPFALISAICIAFVLLSHWPIKGAKRLLVQARVSPSATPASSAVLGAYAPGASVETTPQRIAMTHGDGRRTHRAAGKGPMQATLKWKAELGSAVVTQPIPSTDGRAVFVGTMSGDLVRLSLQGVIEWRRPLGGRVYGAPIVTATGDVWAGSDDHALYAFSPSGDLRFRLKTDDEVDVPLLLRKDGSVVFASGKDVLSVSSRGNLEFQFHAKRKVFTAVAEDASGLLVFGSQDNRVYALSPRGDLQWELALGSDVDGAPVVADDGSFFVGTDAGELVHVSPKGHLLKRTSLGGYVRGSLSISRDGTLLVGTYGPDPGMLRISTEGAILGSFRIPSTHAKEFGVHGGAVEDETGALYFGAQDNRIYAFNPDGTLRFAYETGADVDAPLTLLPDGRLVVASEDGSVYCIAD